jgi:ABC-2 type transport system ATP-binding protein
MNMIQVEHIQKTFKVARRNAGMKEAFLALFNKKYEYVKALDDISFTIADGEMVGYIGPNGAGKSSTIKILSGILTPEGGSCLINGRTPWKDRIAHVRDIGVVFGQRSQLWWDVPVIDSFELLKDIYKVPEKKFKDNLSELVTLLNLEEIIKTPARQLSLGQRMRCEIAASLLHNPSILFLDEPTIGLDAVSKIAVRNFILDINKRHKTTVILTTHDMQDIEALTKRIILIGKGKILMDGELSEMKKQFGGYKKLMVEYCGGGIHVCEGMHMISNDYSHDDKGVLVDGHAVIELDSDIIPVSDAIAALSAEVDLRDISVSGSSIDEVVVELYKQYEI